MFNIPVVLLYMLVLANYSCSLLLCVYYFLFVLQNKRSYESNMGSLVWRATRSIGLQMLDIVTIFSISIVSSSWKRYRELVYTACEPHHLFWQSSYELFYLCRIYYFPSIIIARSSFLLIQTESCADKMTIFSNTLTSSW